MLRYLNIVFLFCIFSESTQAQILIQGYLQPDDRIVVKENEAGQMIWPYVLKPKNTLYGLSKLSGVSVERIIRANPEINTRTLSIGDTIDIPIDSAQNIILGTKTDASIPVYYIVKPGENLYHIAKKKLTTSVDALVRLNLLKGHLLEPGQNLLVGGLAYAADSTTEIRNRVSDASQRLSAFAKAYSQEQIYTQKGIAYWRKAGAHGLFVLHPKARIGSVIELNNPMFETVVYAKVVGRLPERAYTSDIKVVVSTDVAKKLGALDERFFVVMRYIN